MPTRRLRVALTVFVAMGPASISAQVQVTAPTRSTTMGREILLLDFAAGANARATLPTFVTRVRANDGEPEIRPDGYMQMVVKDGQRMLKASGQVALLVTLPDALPPDFTVEFDIVPKPCCNPEDISIEGTKAIDRGAESALVAWRYDGLWIYGGGFIRPYSAEMPKELDGKLVGQLTKIVFEFQGDQLRVFTNGIQHLPDPPPAKFQRRNKVLRVLIGGDVNNVGRDVYLARMRVMANSPSVVAGTQAAPPNANSPGRTGVPPTASGPGRASSRGPTNPGGSTVPPPSTTPSTPISEGVPSGRGSAPALQPVGTGPAPSALTITGTPTTASLSWNAVPGATGYKVTRALQGSVSSTTLTASNTTATTFPGDVLPDPAKTYTYSVFAYQADGTYGIAKADFLAPKATDPTGFTASSPLAAVVELTWQAVPGVTQYYVSGPGIPPNAQTTGTKFSVSGVKPGLQAYRVASLYPPGGTLMTPSSAWPSATVKVVPTPAAPWLTLSNGIGSQAEYFKHKCNAGQWLASQLVWVNTWCGPPPVSLDENATNNGALPLLTAFGIQEYQPSEGKDLITGATFDLYVPVHQWTTFRHWRWARGNQLAPNATFVDAADLGSSREVGCVQKCVGVSTQTLCWARTDLDRVSVIVHTQQETQFLMFYDLMEQDWGGGFSKCPVPRDVWDWQCGRLFHAQSMVFDKNSYDVAKRYRYAPHACLSCHGGKFDPSTGKVTGASLLPLDPRGFTYPYQKNRADYEEDIRKINLMIYNSNPSTLVRRYINDMYRGQLVVPRAVVDDNYVPPGWSTQSGLYRNVYRPYCASCHNTQTGSLGFGSWGDLLREKVRVRQGICSGTMPHAEVPFKKFWSEGGPSVSWPGVLLQALGVAPC